MMTDGRPFDCSRHCDYCVAEQCPERKGRTMTQTRTYIDDAPVTSMAHLKEVVQAVFKAEHEIIAQGWQERLRKAKTLPRAEREREADAYITAVASEIVKNQLKTK